MGRFAKLEQYSSEENDFWYRFIACTGRVFTTMRGLEFSFEARGNEVFFDRKAKSVTRATIIRGYRKALELMRNDGGITSPKQLGVFGASYILPILMTEEFNVISSLSKGCDNTPAQMKTKLRQLQFTFT